MNVNALHSIKDFALLRNDERFAALLIYLRERRPKGESIEPHGMIKDCGRIEQYVRTMEMIDEAFEKPAPELPPSLRPPPYTSGPNQP